MKFLTAAFLFVLPNVSFAGVYCGSTPSFPHPLSPSVSICSEQKLFNPNLLGLGGGVSLSGSVEMLTADGKILSDKSTPNKGKCSLSIVNSGSALSISVKIEAQGKSFEFGDSIALPWTGKPLLMTDAKPGIFSLDFFKHGLRITQSLPNQWDLNPGTSDFNISIGLDSNNHPTQFTALEFVDSSNVGLSCSVDSTVGALPMLNDVLFK